MIDNGTQYLVTKNQISKLKEAIEWHELMLSALRSQVEELEEKVRWYEEDNP